jgi:hypothetical protein
MCSEDEPCLHAVITETANSNTNVALNPAFHQGKKAAFPASSPNLIEVPPKQRT